MMAKITQSAEKISISTCTQQSARVKQKATSTRHNRQ
jgi:hypothetical protein